MNTKIEKTLTFFGNNVWVIFVINIKGLFDSLEWIYKIIFKDNYNMETPPIGYNEIMLFITSLIMYALFKLLVSYIQNVSSELTKNLNDLSRVLDNKIRYVDFEKDNKDLDNDTYIQKLHNNGFSLEDLKEIGVDDVFLKNNEDKLLPKNVIEKYIAFKNELEIHKTKS